MYAVHKACLALAATLCATTHAAVQPKDMIDGWIREAHECPYLRTRYQYAKDFVVAKIEDKVVTADMKPKLQQAAVDILKIYPQASFGPDDTSRVDQYLVCDLEISKRTRKKSSRRIFHDDSDVTPLNKWTQDLLNFLQADFNETKSCFTPRQTVDATEEAGYSSSSRSRSPSPSQRRVASRQRKASSTSSSKSPSRPATPPSPRQASPSRSSSPRTPSPASRSITHASEPDQEMEASPASCGEEATKPKSDSCDIKTSDKIDHQLADWLRHCDDPNKQLITHFVCWSRLEEKHFSVQQLKRRCVNLSKANLENIVKKCYSLMDESDEKPDEATLKRDLKVILDLVPSLCKNLRLD